jgi:hypothetical protein
VNAAPGSRVGINAGPALNSATVAPNMGALAVISTFGNPFAATWRSTFTWAASATRVYQPAGQLPVTLNAGLSAVVTPPNDNRTIGFLSCFPTSVAVQGATLITDGLTVTIDRSKPVAVSFVADRLEADLYTIALLEVTNVGGAMVLVNRFNSVHRQPAWSLPAEVFETGKQYTVRASCTLGGFPKLATGDLSERELPISGGFIDSGVFTVVQ